MHGILSVILQAKSTIQIQPQENFLILCSCYIYKTPVIIHSIFPLPLNLNSHKTLGALFPVLVCSATLCLRCCCYIRLQLFAQKIFKPILCKCARRWKAPKLSLVEAFPPFLRAAIFVLTVTSAAALVCATRAFDESRWTTIPMRMFERQQRLLIGLL